jgi:hypothetical protein
VRLSRRGPAVLLFIAVAIVLSHVCALPTHAHADQPAAHTSHGSDPAHEGVHGASCEAVKPTASSAVPAGLPQAATVESTAITLQTVPAARDRVPDSRSSPPLFLLHAALLI